MSVERFSAWYSIQPELIQQLVLFGPPFLVSIVIAVALGGRVRLMVLAWRFNPTLAAAVDSLDAQAEEEADGEWAHRARVSVDQLVERRRRGVY